MRIDAYWPSPSPALIEQARAGELPRCVTVVVHKIRGRDVTMTGVDLNDVVMQVGYWEVGR